jgi:Arc/MetJ-type ribon-helix-helix transcriptional regulator
MTKIAVSLPDEQVEAAKRAVAAGRASSVSAYVADALARAQREDSLKALLDEMDQELGEPSEEAKAWADAELRRVGLLG